MKRSQLLSILKLVAICILTLVVPYAATNAAMQHGFRFNEYDAFHDVLHPLQHEALPQEDFQRIRSMANELVTRGKAIVKLGVPDERKSNRRDFAKALREFDRALARFKIDAKAKNDAKLKKSYIAVHDLFERLADLVPFHNPGPPPAISLNCPSSKVEAGSELTLIAYTGVEGALLWNVGAAKILTGQGARSIAVDTFGLAGQTIPVKVEGDDGSGHAIRAECVIQISASK